MKVLGCCLLELLCESFKWVPHVVSVVAVTIVVSVIVVISVVTSVVVTSISSVIRVVSIPSVVSVVVVVVDVGFSGSRSGLPWFSCTTIVGLEHVAKAGDKMHPCDFFLRTDLQVLLASFCVGQRDEIEKRHSLNTTIVSRLLFTYSCMDRLIDC